MVHLGPTPGRGRVMTALARGRGGQVITRLARCRCSVVATGATRCHRDVGVQLGWQPIRITRLVASCAIVCRWNVFCRFPRSTYAVVATGAVGCRVESGVIHLGTSPGRG